MYNVPFSTDLIAFVIQCFDYLFLLYVVGAFTSRFVYPFWRYGCWVYSNYYTKKKSLKGPGDLVNKLVSYNIMYWDQSPQGVQPEYQHFWSCTGKLCKYQFKVRINFTIIIIFFYDGNMRITEISF